MEIVKTISEWKKRPKASTKYNKPIKPGHKRVQAIIREGGELVTRHIDVTK